MDPSRLRHYRELLDARAAELARRVHAGLRASDEEQPVPDGRDPADEAVRLDAREGATRRSEQQARQLMEIDEARARLTRGEYGLCEDCGEEIDPARLELLPEARRCARDQEAYERECVAQRPTGQI